MPQPSLADHARQAMIKAHMHFIIPPQFMLLATPEGKTAYGYVDMTPVPYRQVQRVMQRILAHNPKTREYIYVGPMIERNAGGLRDTIAIIWVKEGQPGQGWRWIVDRMENGVCRLGEYGPMGDLLIDESPILNLLHPGSIN